MKTLFAGTLETRRPTDPLNLSKVPLTAKGHPEPQLSGSPWGAAFVPVPLVREHVHVSKSCHRAHVLGMYVQRNACVLHRNKPKL